MRKIDKKVFYLLHNSNTESYNEETHFLDFPPSLFLLEHNIFQKKHIVCWWFIRMDFLEAEKAFWWEKYHKALLELWRNEFCKDFTVEFRVLWHFWKLSDIWIYSPHFYFTMEFRVLWHSWKLSDIWIYSPHFYFTVGFRVLWHSWKLSDIWIYIRHTFTS